jgi:hypothetical protein
MVLVFMLFNVEYWEQLCWLSRIRSKEMTYYLYFLLFLRPLLFKSFFSADLSLPVAEGGGEDLNSIVSELAETHKRMLEELLARQEQERRLLRQQFEDRQQQLIRHDSHFVVHIVSYRFLYIVVAQCC